MMQRRLFAGLYHRKKFPVVSRARAMALDPSSPIRSLRVTSRDESEDREREMTSNKRSALSLRCDDDWKLGVASRLRRERVIRSLKKRSLSDIPPKTEEERGARDASRTSHRASARNFRLIRSTSVGDGGLAWARFRAEEMIVEATERDPRLHGRV